MLSHKKLNLVVLHICALCGTYPYPVSLSDFTFFFKLSQLNKIVLKQVEKIARLNNAERNQAIGMLNAGMSATVESRHFGCIERLSSVNRDDSVSQETLPTILEVVSHM